MQQKAASDLSILHSLSLFVTHPALFLDTPWGSEMDLLIKVGFNDTSILVGHFVSSPGEKEKRDKRDSRPPSGPLSKYRFLYRFFLLKI